MPLVILGGNLDCAASTNFIPVHSFDKLLLSARPTKRWTKSSLIAALVSHVKCAISWLVPTQSSESHSPPQRSSLFTLVGVFPATTEPPAPATLDLLDEAEHQVALWMPLMVVSSPGRCLALPAPRPAHGIRIYHQVSNYWGAQPSFQFSPSLNTHSGCPCLLQRAIRKFVLCPKFSCARRSSYEKDQTSAHLKGTHGIQSTASFERRERGARRNSIIFRPMSARAGAWASVSLIRASGHCIPIHDVGLAALSEDKSSGASVRLHAIAVRSGDCICKGAMIVRTALGGMPRTLR